MDLEKLKKLQAQVRIGGKGTPRRKVVKKPKAGSSGDDKKLQGALKKLAVQPIQGVEEVNMFKDDGNVLHFSAPKVNAAVNANTFVVYGAPQNKELTELVPGILNQLGPDSLATLRKLAETYQNMQGIPPQAAAAAAAIGEDKEADDDDLPDLVESFDVEHPTSESKLEEIN